MKKDPDDWSPLLDRINASLAGAEILLDRAAEAIVRSQMEGPANISRIGDALQKISEVQDELYQLEPEFGPVYLRDTKRWKSYFDKRR